jgi:long-chain acyl-CoA synthetase
MSAIDWLLGRIHGLGDAAAIIWRDEATTFHDLATDVEAWTEQLHAAAVEPGAVVTLEGDYSPRACAALLALARRGAVVVPLASVTGAERAEFQRIAEVGVVVTVADGQISRRPLPATPSNPVMREFLGRAHPGLVLFSSGSTGQPKAILHDLSVLVEKFRRPRPALRTLAFLLLDHIGGLNTLFHTLANGGTVVVGEARDPANVCTAIERHRVELLPTSPTFLNLLLASREHERCDLASLKLITYGTEVMPPSLLARLHAALPHVELRQTYGLSEVGILRAKSLASDSTWVKLGGEGYETRIIDGTLRIRARSSMVGYLNYPSPFDADGWLDTGDVVEVNGEYVRFVGRQSGFINVGGQKVYPAEVEDVLLEMPELTEVLVHGEKNPVLGEVVVARVRTAIALPGAELRARVRAHCAGRLAAFKVPSRVVVADQPLHNARFKKLAGPAPAPTPPPS